MGVSTFKGGTHPYDGKALSMDQAIRELQPQGEMVFPLSQHIGAPAKPVVVKGDHVLVGQKIAEAGGFVSACIVSSVSGTVKGVEKRLSSNGVIADAIVIENDQKYDTVEGFGTERDSETLSKEEIREIVKEAGIVGLGGAGFPTHIKLTPKDDSKIDYFLVNGAECEPYLTSDYRMMLEQPEKIIGGLKVILRLFPNAKGIICIEDNKPKAIEKLSSMVQGESRVEVRALKTKYPQGGERQLVYAVTGRKINSSMLPADAGCVVDNIDTVVSVYEAVCRNIPLIRRILTVTGDAVAEPGNFMVRTGTSYQEVLAAAGGFRTEPAKVISGGPMMGIPLFDLNIPVTKNSSAITAFVHDIVAEELPTACIRCGRCVEVCPEHLIPPMMMRAALHEQVEEFEKIYGMECIECGCCAYICPARRPLTQAFKEMKKKVNGVRKTRLEKAKANTKHIEKQDEGNLAGNVNLKKKNEEEKK